MKKEILALALLLFITKGIYAITWVVDLNGTGDAITIQAGIDLSVSGDTVLVMDGVYTGEIVISNKMITLASYYFADNDTTHIANTIIDGEDTRTGIKILNCIQGANWTQVIGFTIRNGRGDWVEYDDLSIGGGIAVSYSMVRISDCIIYNNRAYQGGGIGTMYSFVHLIHNKIYHNTAIYAGGGIAAVRGLENQIAFDETRRNSVYLNHSAQGSDIAISMMCVPSIVYLETGTVTGADSFYFMPPSQFQLDILYPAVMQTQQDLWVSPNGNDNNSGLNPTSPLQTMTYALAKANPDSLHPITIHLLPGTYNWSGTKQPFPIQVKSYLTIDGGSRVSVILDAEDYGAFFTGLFYWDHFKIRNLTCINGRTLKYGIQFSTTMGSLTGDYIEIENVTIRDTWCVNDLVRLSSYKSINVSGIIIQNCQNHTGLFIDGFLYARVGNTIVQHNSPSFYDWPQTYSCGMVLMTYEQYPQHAKIEVINCLIADNNNQSLHWGPTTSGLSVGIGNGNTEADVINCTIAGNFALETHTPGFTTGGVNYRVNVYNTIISGNTPYEAGMNTTLDADSAIVAFNHCLVTGGESSFFHSSGLGTSLWLTGNLYGSPVYDSTSQYSYYPGMSSPTIDSGTLNLPGNVIMPIYDLAGNPRVYNGNIDIGCYEWDGTANQDENIPLLTDKLNLTNYPNPFNPSTTILYSLPKDMQVNLVVYNIKGQKIKTLHNGKQAKGQHSVIWDGTDENGKLVSSGIYFYKLVTPNKVLTSKMVMLK